MKTQLNLLPIRTVQRQTALRLLRIWGYAAGLAMLLVIAWTVHEEHLTAQAQHRLSTLQVSYDETHNTLRNVRLLRSELTTLEQQGSLLPDTDNQQLLSLLGLFSSAAQANAHGVAIENLTYTLDVSRPDGLSPSDQNALRVELRGVAYDAVALAEFIAAIRAWDIFAHVAVKSSGEVRIGDLPAYRYVVECTY